MNLINVFNSIEKNGGATYNINTGELNPSEGYMVSLVGFEKATKIPENLNEFQNIMSAYLDKKVWDQLAISEDIYLGFWIDGDTFYVDLSEKFEFKEWAITIGYNRNQKAIWDANKKETIYLPILSYDPDLLTDRKY